MWEGEGVVEAGSSEVGVGVGVEEEATSRFTALPSSFIELDNEEDKRGLFSHKPHSKSSCNQGKALCSTAPGLDSIAFPWLKRARPAIPTKTLR